MPINYLRNLKANFTGEIGLASWKNVVRSFSSPGEIQAELETTPLTDPLPSFFGRVAELDRFP